MTDSAIENLYLDAVPRKIPQGFTEDARELTLGKWTTVPKTRCIGIQ